MKKNQKGFGVLEILLLIVALASIIGAGVYVFTSNNHKKSQTPSTATGSNTNMLAIKELGIEIPLTKELADLKYKPDNQETNGVLLYTDAYAAADKVCTGAAHEPESINFLAVSKSTQNADPDGLLEAVTLKKFKNFRLVRYDGPTTPCFYANNPEGLSQLNQIKSKLEDATVKAFKNSHEVK